MPKTGYLKKKKKKKEGSSIRTLDMALVFHAKQDKRVTEMNHNPRRHSFQQIKALIVLEAVSAKEKMQEPQSNQYLKRSLFIKDRSIHFHITSTRALIKKVTSYPRPQSIIGKI